MPARWWQGLHPRLLRSQAALSEEGTRGGDTRTRRTLRGGSWEDQELDGGWGEGQKKIDIAAIN